MNVTRQKITVTTDASGDATSYSAAVNGFLSSIQYVATDYTAGVDFTITEEETGATLWTQLNVNASAICAPRQHTHDTAGVGLLYAAAGAAVGDMIAVAGRIKIVIAAGGAAKVGTFYINVI